MADRIVFVEDSYGRTSDIRRLLELFRTGRAHREGTKLPPLIIAPEVFWDPKEALERVTGGAAPDEVPGPGAERWDVTDQVFLDCWDHDAVFESTRGRGGSAFFALDILRSFRSAAEAGNAVPRIIVHSRGMADELLRVALGEFCRSRRQVRVPGRAPVVRWRVDPDSSPDSGIVWAMFDRTTVERNLDRVLLGDRSGAMGIPGPDSPVWTQLGPASCLASFHCALRDECPDIWASWVTGHADREQVDATTNTRITRLAKRYLDLRDSWGERGYRAYLGLARSLANPGV